jgi:hypothetical protein
LATVGTGVSGIGGALKAGVISATAAIESLSVASINEGNGGGSMIGSLSSMRGRNGGKQAAPASFPRNDPTGDRTVADLIRKTRNPYSQRS